LYSRFTIGGIPSSGKTTYAKELISKLQEEGKKVYLVNEEALNINKNIAYKGITMIYHTFLVDIDAKEEKMIRGSLLAEVERYISADTILVFDSLNYIKGYRYELFCRARSLRTPTCVVISFSIH
jgi:protein KTI12